MASAGKGLFIAGVLAGGIAVPAVLFAAGWIVTSGASNAAARDSAKEAVVESLAPICVKQFSETSGRDDMLVKLKALSRWERPDFVTRNGWATMPGGKSPNSFVASECARRLATLEE
jgi:hypothetical protein